jgi:predicted nucleic-acid-binding protein
MSTGIDTNVLVRYLVEDDPAQSALARRFVAQQCSIENPGRVCCVVLCELAWVLRQSYDYDRATIAHTLEELLAMAELDIEQPEAVRAALGDFRAGSAGFTDYLVAHLNAQAGAGVTVTFDQHAAKHRLFNLLK